MKNGSMPTGRPKNGENRPAAVRKCLTFPQWLWLWIKAESSQLGVKPCDLVRDTMARSLRRKYK